uniref:Uncharacterized protein n=1 Tax=Salmonella sp. TaxID=599 RepID=A0A482ETE5_SALSP|nr:hypothetical protein NNIBIDOC_00048 [Salmonella sp.]
MLLSQKVSRSLKPSSKSEGQYARWFTLATASWRRNARGLTEAKCRNLSTLTGSHRYAQVLTPECVASFHRGLISLHKITPNRMMSEAEHRGKRWYHPKMGQFSRLGR